MAQKKFYCVGAAHIDVKARSRRVPRLGESIPVTTKACLGGVACNIAINLAHAGGRVGICSLVGRDAEGQALKNLISSHGIDVSDMGFSDRSPTAKYYAILKNDGELFVATAEMGIYDELTPERVMPLIKGRRDISDVILDANIPTNSIQAIRNNLSAKQRLWGVGVSAYKTARLCGGLPSWFGLLINRQELYSLCGTKDLTKAMQSLMRQGCSRVVVTAGADGVYYCQGPRILHRGCPPLRVIDVTGAGDAFSAGVIYSLAHNDDFEEAIDFGFSLAAKALLSSGSSPKNELDTAKRRMKEALLK